MYHKDITLQHSIIEIIAVYEALSYWCMRTLLESNKTRDFARRSPSPVPLLILFFQGDTGNWISEELSGNH
jgi:hypothetical protein